MISRTNAYALVPKITLILCLSVLTPVVKAQLSHDEQFEKIENFIENNRKRKLEDDKEYTIKNIIVEGNKTTKKELILNRIPYKQGDIFDQEKSSQAINNLYAIGAFRGVSIEVEELDKQNVSLFIILEEKKLLENLEIEGNKAITSKKIKEDLKLKKLTTIDEETLRRIVKAITKMYVEEHRHFVNITTDIIPNKKNPDKATAKIIITEGPKTAVKRVMFTGNKHLDGRLIRKKIFTRENWLLSFSDGAGTYKPEELELDKHRVAYLYRDQGYLMAKVTKTDVEFSDDNTDVSVTFHVHEGDHYTIRTISVPGDEIFTEKELLPYVSLKEGESYSQTEMQNSLIKLRDLWGEKGYIYADVYPQVKPDEQTKEIDITFYVERGNKLYAGRIDITGNIVTHDSLIRRQLDIVEGDLITTKKLARSRNSVEYLSFFERDGVTWNLHRITDEIADLEMNVREAKTGHFNFQLSYGNTRHNARSSVKGMLSLSKSNLFGRGWDVGGMLQGTRHGFQKFEAHFFDPYFLNSDVSAGFYGYVRRDEYDQWRTVDNTPEQRVIGANSRFGFRFPEFDKRVQFFFETGIENIKNQNFRTTDAELAPIIARRFKEGVLHWVGLDLIKDTRNHQVYPNKGYRLALLTRSAIPGLNSNYGFFKAEGRASNYVSLIGIDSLVLATQFKFGFIRSLGHKDIPYKELFHMGGQDTVRGHIWGGIGPAWVALDASGRPLPQHADPLGAQNMVQFNAELIFPLVPDYSMKGHFFYDAGAGWETPKRDIVDRTRITRDKFDVRHSVGFGINLMQPFPAKLDWGFKLDRRKKLGESSHEFHLSMNYAW